MRILGISGSLRRGSHNRRLLRAAGEALAPGAVLVEWDGLAGLPHYDEDLDAVAFPAAVTEFKERIKAADGVLFVTPEYNRSVPGVLKNAIDIASRPYAASAFTGKPAAVCGTSIGAIGTAVAQQHLRSILAYLDVPTLGQPEVFIHFTDGLIGPDGKIDNAGTREFLQGFADRFVDWVKRFSR